MKNKADRLYFQNNSTKNWLNEGLFNELFGRYWEKLFAFCLSHTNDDEASREMVQDLFLSLWERRKKVEIKTNIGHYLFSGARLKIAKYYRDKAYTEKKISDVGQGVRNETCNTQEYILYKDLQWQLRLITAELPNRSRQVYVMSRNEGLKIREIALKLDLSEKTVEAHLSKALKFLKGRIRQLGF